MILLIDSYDSFTNNLSQLIINNTNKEVITIHNDTFKPEEHKNFFETYLSLFEYIVIGPGPGHPSISKDVGIIGGLFKYFCANKSKSIPILGICLGFQCLCHEFGNEVSKLKDVKHGQVYNVYPQGTENSLFPNDDQVKFPSVRYHSLYVHQLNDEIIPLAYCYEPNDEIKVGSRILMAARHKELPFYGVQYHPESICSSNGGDLICNFDNIANEYNKTYRIDCFLNDKNVSIDLVKELKEKRALHENSLIKGGLFSYKSEKLPKVYLKKFKFNQDPSAEKVRPIDICDYFYNKNDQESNFVLLNSASVPGEWSIIGLPINGQSQIITHSVDNIKEVIISKYNSSDYRKVQLDEAETIWTFIGDEMESNYISRDIINSQLGRSYHTRDLPFFGGCLGFISYEEGQHVIIEKLRPLCTTSTPDLKLIFIERFIIYDHLTDDWFVVSINQDSDDTYWVDELYRELITTNENNHLKLNISSVPASVKELSKIGDEYKIKFDFPSQDIYQKQFDICQDFLHSGDSYELCLTTQSKITLPSYINAWDIYKVLTLHKNPSPFSCFIEFEDCILISSSPERFLSWKDNENKNKLIELRPIKGTVRNTPDISLDEATKILKTPKEMGENLMIVDLIRHDLHQFIDNVSVSQLMSVEEYKTVYQLVSVIQGELKGNGYHGIDILHKSLPPGSMTGAPKKRSIELLQEIESMQVNGNPGGRRGIYSGVVGYWSVTDDSDWSVVIRSIYHYVHDKENDSLTSNWRIGAGGAITVLSDIAGEWEEMRIKLSSALQAFN